MKAVVMPIGVTRETVEGVFRQFESIDLIVTVTMTGYEDIKKPIIGMIKGTAKLTGAKHYTVMVDIGSIAPFVKVYNILSSHRPDTVYLVGVTGSRYLLPPLFTVLLKYWRDTGATIYLLHGVEGEEYQLVQLPGFCSVTMRLSEIQKRILRIIYGSEETLSGKELIERKGFTKSVYYVLQDLEKKGLLVVRRGRIEKTFPGKLVHALLETRPGEGDKYD